MTIEEALKYTDRIRLTYPDEKEGRANVYFILTVREALEKQIPKEILKETIDTIFGEIILDVCPSCKTSFGGRGQFNGYKFCPYCGQALDWNEDGRKKE